MSTPLLQDLPQGLRDPERRTVTNVLFKDKAVLLEYSHETGGTHTKSALTLEARGGNPLHFHRTYAEHFQCISGTLSVELGRNPKIDLQPGESLLVPMRQNHRFFNATDETVEAEIPIYPGNVGFEKGIYIAYGLADDGLCNSDGIPKNFLHMCVFTCISHITLPGVFGGLMGLVMSAGAWVARKTGWKMSYFVNTDDEGRE
jgi:quercetin dioxygenase-like cupin family protein